MASDAEREARSKWPADRAAAFDRLVARFWERAAELAQDGDGAELELHLRFNRGSYSEGRFDPDERFA